MSAKDSIVAVSVDGVRIGSVMWFAGEPVAKRWVAYSIHRTDPKVERREGFRTLRAARGWLVAVHRQSLP